MKATLVYDGGALLRIPEEMGSPKPGQLEGTPMEQVAELCGRVCYDSLGQGRASEEYHEHIHEVGHYSVYEHTPITVAFKVTNECDYAKLLHCLMNRPGIYLTPVGKDNDIVQLRVSANFRAIIEWNKIVNRNVRALNVLHTWVGEILRYFANQLAPQIVKENSIGTLNDSNLVEPKYPQEKWITLFMVGSRGFSHEQVRHGDYTAISQRSTRYVDESESNWVWHPLVIEYLKETKDVGMRAVFEGVTLHCQESYDTIVETLQPWLLNKGIDKLSARKQARGAARGFLGNALETEMMFSASVAQWKHMISMRATKYADAEIRQIYTEGVIPALQQSQYAEEFAYRIQPSDDGIGHVAIDISEDI